MMNINELNWKLWSQVWGEGSNPLRPSSRYLSLLNKEKNKGTLTGKHGLRNSAGVSDMPVVAMPVSVVSAGMVRPQYYNNTSKLR